jgi:hypothetical protein
VTFFTAFDIVHRVGSKWLELLEEFHYFYSVLLSGDGVRRDRPQRADDAC